MRERIHTCNGLEYSPRFGIRVTLSKAFLTCTKTWCKFCWRYLSRNILRLKICFVALRPSLYSACSSKMKFPVRSFSLFSTIYNMTSLGWLIRLNVRQFLSYRPHTLVRSIVRPDLQAWPHDGLHSVGQNSESDEQI